jgi:hypothetical protein
LDTHRIGDSTSDNSGSQLIMEITLQNYDEHLPTLRTGSYGEVLPSGDGMTISFILDNSKYSMSVETYRQIASQGKEIPFPLQAMFERRGIQ